MGPWRAKTDCNLLELEAERAFGTDVQLQIHRLTDSAFGLPLTSPATPLEAFQGLIAPPAGAPSSMTA